MYKDFQKYNLFRAPSWRWDRVLSLVERERSRCSLRDDEYVREAKNFVTNYRRLSAENRVLLFPDNPGLYYAYLIQEESDPDVECVIQARLLAGQSAQTIADSVATIASTIEWYEALFFNVADRVKDKKMYRDWIVRTILGPAALRGIQDREFDLTAKMFGYFGGPIVLDAILHGLTVTEIPADKRDINQFFDNQFATLLKRKSTMAALNLQVNKFNVMQLFEIHTQLRTLEHTIREVDGATNEYEKQVQSMLLEIPWSAGTDGQEAFAGTPILEFQSFAAELRTDEILLIAAGHEPDGLRDHLRSRVLPPPQPKKEEPVDEPPINPTE